MALVRTDALEFCKPVFRNSIKFRKDNPARPKSVKAVFTQVIASARTLGAFCLHKGSYAMVHKINITVQGRQRKNVPCPRTNCNEVFSEQARSASPAGFFSFKSPSFSVR